MQMLGNNVVTSYEENETNMTGFIAIYKKEFTGKIVGFEAIILFYQTTIDILSTVKNSL